MHAFSYKTSPVFVHVVLLVVNVVPIFVSDAVVHDICFSWLFS